MTKAVLIYSRRTATHEYRVYLLGPHGLPEGVEAFEASFRPLNPRTGEPWQAVRRIEIGADVTPGNFRRPICFSTIDKAVAAIHAQEAKAAKGRADRARRLASDEPAAVVEKEAAKAARAAGWSRNQASGLWVHREHASFDGSAADLCRTHRIPVIVEGVDLLAPETTA